MTNTAAQTTKAAILNPCLCSTFEVVIREWTAENGQPEIETVGTGCTANTAREFAPGSDAKLKSLLIMAGVKGLEVRRNVGGAVISGDAMTMARDFNFAYMVEAGIARGQAKAAARAEKKAARAAAPKKERPAGRAARKVTAAPAASTTAHVVATAAPAPVVVAPAIETVEIKVGRWTYLATIAANGDAHYTSGKGAAAVAVKGTYKLV